MRGQRAGLRGREVGDANRADLAGLHLGIQRGGDVGPMGEHVGPVDLPYIDALDAHAAERGVDSADQIFRRTVIGHAHADAALRR